MTANVADGWRHVELLTGAVVFVGEFGDADFLAGVDGEENVAVEAMAPVVAVLPEIEVKLRAFGEPELFVFLYK